MATRGITAHGNPPRHTVSFLLTALRELRKHLDILIILPVATLLMKKSASADLPVLSLMVVLRLILKRSPVPYRF